METMNNNTMNNNTLAEQPGTLATRAMLVNLTISQWRGRKFDRQTSDRIDEAYDCEGTAGRYHKILINHPDFKAVGKIINKIRAYHYSITLPWLDNGPRILSVKAYWEYVKAMAEYRAEFDMAFQIFASSYADIVRSEKKRLGRMFNPDDYPSTAEIREKFSINTTFYPLPQGEDFRTTLDDDAANEIRAEMIRASRERNAAAMRDVWSRMYKVVQTFAEKLKENTTFRDSLVGNVYELVELLPYLNIVDDQRLTDMAADIKRTIAGLNPNDIRTDDAVRTAAIRDADDILKKMGMI